VPFGQPIVDNFLVPFSMKCGLFHSYAEYWINYPKD
jgi:hypothetical protein